MYALIERTINVHVHIYHYNYTYKFIYTGELPTITRSVKKYLL
jgi:hypothetical protein